MGEWVHLTLVSGPSSTARASSVQTNPLDIRENFRATIAANTPATEQWRYTVPANRQAQVQLGGVFAQNAQGGDQACSIRDQYGPIITAHSGGLSQGAYASEQQNLDFLLDAGEYLFAQTVNQGNSGSDQSAWLYAVEYDATPASAPPATDPTVLVNMANATLVTNVSGNSIIYLIDGDWLQVAESLDEVDHRAGRFSRWARTGPS
jgi:hypothetical protein